MTKPLLWGEYWIQIWTIAYNYILNSSYLIITPPPTTPPHHHPMHRPMPINPNPNASSPNLYRTGLHYTAAGRKLVLSSTYRNHQKIFKFFISTLLLQKQTFIYQKSIYILENNQVVLILNQRKHKNLISHRKVNYN